MTGTLTIEERKAALAQHLTDMKSIADAVLERGDDFTDDERSRLTELQGKAKEHSTALKAARKNSAFHTDLKSFMDEGEAELTNQDALLGAQLGLPGSRKSLGEHFVKSDEFVQAMKKAQGSRSDVAQGTRISTDPVAVSGGLKALLQTGTPGGDGVNNLYDAQRIPTVQATWPELKLRNVITVGQTSSDQVKYARVLRAGIPGGSVNNAAGVPEATTTAPVGSGNPAVTPAQAGVKPESAIKFSTETASVVTIAHWIPATKKALSDAGQIRTLIDNFLRNGLDQELERQILAGDSSAGEEFDGLLNTDGIQAQAFDTNIVTTVRRAITKVRRYGRPNAILVSPGTAERIDLLRIATGAYLGGGPFGPSIANMWRVPLVEIAGLDDDTVLLGDFSTAVLWDREEATITATDSHADFFVRNLVVILAEARAAFGVLDPALIARVDVSGQDQIAPVEPEAPVAS